MSEIVAQNKQAHFHYELLETFEVGIVLKGSEVKSVRQGHISLQEAWVQVDAGEIWIKNLLIPPYKQASFDIPDPTRPRKLLAHKREILQMAQGMERKGMTLVPLKLFFSKSHLKLQIALGRGKSHGDKRETIKEREDKRSMQRALKQSSR